jgi:hypothetical protein
MGHTYTQLLTHVVFSTKDRIPYLTESTKDAVFAYMAGIAREIGVSDVTIHSFCDRALLVSARTDSNVQRKTRGHRSPAVSGSS